MVDDKLRISKNSQELSFFFLYSDYFCLDLQGSAVPSSPFPPQTHTFKGLDAEGNHLSRRPLQAQCESLMSSLLTLYFHTHSHLLGSCSEGRAICRLCQLSLTRAQASCLWPRSYSPNLIWWLNYGFFPKLLPGVHGGGAGTLSLPARLTWSITVTVPPSGSHLAGPPACSVALLQKKWGTKKRSCSSTISSRGHLSHVLGKLGQLRKWNKEEPDILVNVHMQLVCRCFTCLGWRWRRRRVRPNQSKRNKVM